MRAFEDNSLSATTKCRPLTMSEESKHLGRLIPMILRFERKLRDEETSHFDQSGPHWKGSGQGTTKIFCESGSLTLLPGAYPLTSISPPLGSNGL